MSQREKKFKNRRKPLPPAPKLVKTPPVKSENKSYPSIAGIIPEKKQDTKEGAHGLVEFFQNSQGKWARKKLKIRHGSNLLREAFVGMALPPHENLIHFRDIEFDVPKENQEKATAAFVMPQAEMTLSEKMPEVYKLTSIQLISVIQQLFCAVHALHQFGLLHLDIKPANILVMSWPKTEADNDLPHIKLIDYGLTLPQSPRQNIYPNELITSWYRPPDFLCRSGRSFLDLAHLNTKADIFSAGMVTLQMLAYWLFPGTKPLPFYARIKRTLESLHGKNVLDEEQIQQTVAQRWMEAFGNPTFSQVSWPKYCGFPFDGKKPLVLNRVQTFLVLFYDDVPKYLQNFAEIPVRTQEWVIQLITLMLPTLFFDQSIRYDAITVINKLNQPPFVQTPQQQQYECKFLQSDIFKPRPKHPPFAWVKDDNERHLLQNVYKQFMLDAKGQYQLYHLEDILQQINVKETDLFVIMLVLLSFLFPVNKSLERIIAQQQLKPGFFKNLSRIFQDLSRQKWGEIPL